MKKNITRTQVVTFLLLGFLSLTAAAQQPAHPLLLLARDDVSALTQQREKLPLLQAAFNDARSYIDAAMQQPIAVPVPRDGGGGFTHEQHKRNYRTIHDAGVL